MRETVVDWALPSFRSRRQKEDGLPKVWLLAGRAPHGLDWWRHRPKLEASTSYWEEGVLRTRLHSSPCRLLHRWCAAKILAPMVVRHWPRIRSVEGIERGQLCWSSRT